MSAKDAIKLEKADGIARITFDRPKHNVFNLAMIHEFNAALEGLLLDDALKCVVIYGQGRSWCAGVDVGDHKPDVVDRMIPAFNRSFELIDAFEVPFIAAVQGACLGGGMEYAIACDVIVASEKAVFGQPEIKLGFFPPYAAVRLPQLVGAARAVEICTTGGIYTAAQAHAMGMVGHVTAPEQLGAKVDAIVKAIAACSPLVIRLNKRAVKAHLGMPLADALAGVSDLFLNTLMKTEDTLEGISSFYEKRRPVWKNA